ncbi:MAG: nickel-dependent hydrogenase large subunit [Actinomycetota bacterium]
MIRVSVRGLEAGYRAGEGMAELLIKPLTRVYGQAFLRIEDEEGTEPRAKVSAYGYRGFDTFARGVHLDNLVPVVSRICGADSLFHQEAACLAVESALGVTPPPAARAVRELALWAQLFERHAVSLFVHSLPDLLFPSSAPALRNLLSIYGVDEDVVRRLMGLKNLGSAVLREVAGKPVHGVNFRPGGVARGVSPEARERLAERLRGAETLLMETARLVKLLLRRNEELVRKGEKAGVSFLALRHPRGTGVFGGTPSLLRLGEEGAVVQDLDGLDQRLRESPTSYGHVVPASLEGAGELLVGPLARLNLNDGYGTPRADEELAEIKETWGFPVRLPLVAHALRMLEIIHAWERMLEILREDHGGSLGESLDPGPGRALVYIEAPEGGMAYDLELDERGLVGNLSIYSPLQFNLRSLEGSLAEAYARCGTEGKERTRDVLQMLVRAYAPCFPCGVH